MRFIKRKYNQQISKALAPADKREVPSDGNGFTKNGYISNVLMTNKTELFQYLWIALINGLLEK